MKRGTPPLYMTQLIAGLRESTRRPESVPQFTELDILDSRMGDTPFSFEPNQIVHALRQVVRLADIGKEWRGPGMLERASLRNRDGINKAVLDAARFIAGPADDPPTLEQMELFDTAVLFTLLVMYHVLRGNARHHSFDHSRIEFSANRILRAGLAAENNVDFAAAKLRAAALDAEAVKLHEAGRFPRLGAFDVFAHNRDQVPYTIPPRVGSERASDPRAMELFHVVWPRLAQLRQLNGNFIHADDVVMPIVAEERAKLEARDARNERAKFHFTAAFRALNLPESAAVNVTIEGPGFQSYADAQQVNVSVAFNPVDPRAFTLMAGTKDGGPEAEFYELMEQLMGGGIGPRLMRLDLVGTR